MKIYENEWTNMKINETSMKNYEHFETSWKFVKSGSQKTKFQGEFGAGHEKISKKTKTKNQKNYLFNCLPEFFLICF